KRVEKPFIVSFLLPLNEKTYFSSSKNSIILPMLTSTSMNHHHKIYIDLLSFSLEEPINFPRLLLMFSRLNTVTIVFMRILQSKKTLTFLTYQTSIDNLSSQDKLARPLTAVRLVSPGLTLCLFICSSLYLGKYSSNSGLGPIRLISPIKILNSSGNSSILVDLNIFPNLVSLCLFDKSSPCSSTSLVILLNL